MEYYITSTHTTNIDKCVLVIRMHQVEHGGEHVVIIRFNKDNPMNLLSHTPLLTQQQCSQPNKATSQKAKGT